MHTVLKKTISILLIGGVILSSSLSSLGSSVYAATKAVVEQQPIVKGCTPKKIQGWILNGDDFSNMNIQIFHNGKLLSENEHYTSINDLVVGTNETIINTSVPGGLLYSLTVEGNILYITDSENNPLDPKNYAIEIRIINNNIKGFYIIGDKDQTDGGYSDGLLYSDQEITCLRQPGSCPQAVVQGWIIDTSSRPSNRIVGASYGEYRFEEKYNQDSETNFLDHLNQRSKDNNMGIVFDRYITIDRSHEVIYIVDSENNPLDPESDYLELFIQDTDTEEYIIPKSNDGKDSGMMYRDLDLSTCDLEITGEDGEEDTDNDQCTSTTVQGWKLNGKDFSNITLGITYNGDVIIQGSYTSLDNLIIGANKAINSYYEEVGGPLYSIAVQDNILYLVDSDKNPLAPKKDVIEIKITDRNIKGWYIIGDQDMSDGGYNGGLLYSNQQLSDCEETPPEENTCDVFKTVQGWEINGKDFSNMSVRFGTYSSENYLMYQEESFQSMNSLIETINKKLYDEYEKIGGPLQQVAIQDNILYVIGSDKNTVDEDYTIELLIMNDNNNSYIIGEVGRRGRITPKIYSDQEISDCQEESHLVCRNNMVGYDLIGKSEIVSFGGTNSKKYGINNELKEPLSDSARIQEILNKDYGNNQVIRQVNDDDSITIRYDNSINPEDITFYVGYEKISDKLKATTPTEYDICDDDATEEVELKTYSICTPNIIYSTDEIITCNFTVTNNGKTAVDNVYPADETMPDGFIIKQYIDEDSPTNLNPGDSLTYTIIGYQSIFPRQGAQILTMGDVVFNYDYKKSSYEINASTTIEIQTKKSSGAGGGGSAISTPSVTDTTTPINNTTTPVIPNIPKDTSTEGSSTGTINTGSNNNNNNDQGSTGNPNSVVTPENIIEVIKQETTKETIERVAATLEDKGGLNFCVYEDYIPLNAWQDITDTEYSKDIRVLINKCIVNGLDNQMLYYGPNKVIKKGEVVKIIAKWFKLSIPTNVKSNENENRWLPYLTSMQKNNALAGVEKRWNDKTMEQAVNTDDIVTILKNIKSDANTDIISAFKTKKVSRKVFAHIITRQ